MLENWMKVSLLLCIFGFFREIRPIEPFTIEYFIREKNMTLDEITRDLYPRGTYAYMFQIVIVFLITDALRWVIIIGRAVQRFPIRIALLDILFNIIIIH